MSSPVQFPEPLQSFSSPRSDAEQNGVLSFCFEMIAEDTTSIEIDLDETPAPVEASTGKKRKREGKFRSRVWEHYTKLVKKPGGREECRCNYCGQLYACSSSSGTKHLNRHIFGLRCSKYKPNSNDSEAPTVHSRDDLEDVFIGTPSGVHVADNPTESTYKEDLESMETQLAHLKDENTKLQQEKDSLAMQKEGLEQLLVTMASETARLTEENGKLKEDCAKLEEEKYRIVSREEFSRLETQVSKLREEFEKERRGYPSAVVAALTQIHKNR